MSFAFVVLPGMYSILLGRYPDMLREYSKKLARTGKTENEADICYGSRRALQQFLRFADPQLQHILVRSLTRYEFKGSDKMEPALPGKGS